MAARRKVLELAAPTWHSPPSTQTAAVRIAAAWVGTGSGLARPRPALLAPDTARVLGGGAGALGAQLCRYV